MKSIETKQSIINDEIKTENLVTVDVGFEFKIENIAVGYRVQQLSTSKPPI